MPFGEATEYNPMLTCEEHTGQHLKKEGWSALMAGIFFLLVGILMIVFVFVRSITRRLRNLRIVYIIMGVLVILVSLLLLYNAWTKFQASRALLDEKVMLFGTASPSGLGISYQMRLSDQMSASAMEQAGFRPAAAAPPPAYEPEREGGRLAASWRSGGGANIRPIPLTPSVARRL